jgi:Raf kinase inhibitor-like YbhB/YbcL family protein
MKIWSDSFKDGAFIQGANAFCMIDPLTHVQLSSNENPHLTWSGLPSGTKSLALICHDPDVPSVGDAVNKEGQTVPADLPRVDFFHWSLIDIPPATEAIAAAQFSSSVTPRGKAGPEVAGLPGLRHGINDYTSWFQGDPDMSGDYFGYDGPCPPWNDAIVHRYIFTLYALDVARLPVTGSFTGQQVRAALAGHVLAQTQITGLYTLNPFLAGPKYSSAPKA